MKTPRFSRSLRAAIAPLLLIAAVGVRPVRGADANSNEDPSALSAIALHWLADWDARNWEACWNAFSPEIKGNIRLDKWSLAEGYFEDHLGKLRSRKFTKIETTIIPGDVEIVEFESSFEHVGNRSEGIYLQKGSKGSWSVYALVIKPMSAEWPRQYRDDSSAGSRPLELHATPGLFR
jgi:hypothetical protein